ncbi:MAG: cysteine synthase A [Acholeplasmataceae bacterium]|jgi:cysteine synthase A|nr:cysteine synthase A [Acholeplasmataceae bacterium]MDY0338550.1 cysteine synthase A [Acholeplasmataceae bacterium]
MSIKQSYIELIGNTPMLRINRYEEKMNSKAEIILKLENFNPMSSVKDRLAFALIESFETKGLIKEDTVFVEPTSGNTGIGLAFICAAKGYKLILIMPETVSKERAQIARALGATVILTEGSLGMKGSIQKAKELIEKNPNYVMPMQFENLANPEIHRKTTALEILKDTESNLDYFVAGVGTGGTITGTGEILKKHIPSIKIIAVEPAGSPMISKGTSGPHKIQGIGAGFIPTVLNQAMIDEVMTITDDEAFETTRLLAKTEGVLVGMSSGAALSAATKLALKEENKGKRIVVIMADTGERYMSTTLFE